jgi:hypothetical protein
MTSTAEVNALTTMAAAGDGPATAVLVAGERERFMPCGKKTCRGDLKVRSFPTDPEATTEAVGQSLTGLRRLCSAWSQRPPAGLPAPFETATQ